MTHSLLMTIDLMMSNNKWVGQYCSLQAAQWFDCMVEILTTNEHGYYDSPRLMIWVPEEFAIDGSSHHRAMGSYYVHIPTL